MGLNYVEKHLWARKFASFNIKHLREKLGRAGSLIKNLRGVGYKIEEK
jgi:DNA-binding response OmpR family regulator